MGYNKESGYMKIGQYVPFLGGGQQFIVARSAAAANDILQRVFGGDPDGRVRYQTTIASALALTTANRGDTIFVAPDHTETISAAAGLALNVAGVNVIGIGTGSNRPTITWATSTAATITISANNVVFRNFVCIGNINLLVTAFDVTGNDCVIDVEWRDTSATVECLRVVTATTVSRLRVNLAYRGFIAGTNVVNAIRLNGVTGADLFVDAYGICTTAWVQFVTTASTNVKVGGIMYTSGITNSTRLVVDTIGGSTWTATVNDSSRGATVEGSSASAFAVNDVSAIAANLNVPSADSTSNTLMRDVVGNKSDVAQYTVAATRSLMGYGKALMNANIMATGTFTTSSATVPADTGRTEADNYWKGCTLIPLTGTVALQPRTIASFTNAGGVFTLDSDRPFTVAPGLVTYVIVKDLAATVPATDATVNTMVAHVIGSKADTAIATAPTATGSLVGYTKTLMNRTTGGRQTNSISIAATGMTGTTTRFTINNGPIRVHTIGFLVTTAIPAGANTLKVSFTPTGGAATDLSGATDTASAAGQQLFIVDATKATALVKTTDVGIQAAGQKDNMPMTLSSGVIQTVFSAGAPASGALIMYIEWESLNPFAATVT